MIVAISAALLIPILCLLAFNYKSHYVHLTDNLKEYLLASYGINLVCLIIFCVISYYNVQFTEVWHCKITKVEHQEKWTTEEWYTEEYVCGTDSKGNAEYCTRTVYYTETHGPYWYAYDEYGRSYSINYETYTTWKRIWNNQHLTGVHKGSSHGWDRAISGNIYEARWDNKFATIFPWHSFHRYKNKVRLSNTVFDGKIDKEVRQKYYRPADKKISDGLISFGSTTFSDYDKWQFDILNAELGPRHQIHIIVIAIDAQESPYLSNQIVDGWQGTNKNELCLFLGMKDKQIEWARTFSWLDDTVLHSKLNHYCSQNPQFNAKKLSRHLLKIVPQHWKRKEFKDFEYLQTDLSWTFILSFSILILGANVVIYRLSHDS